MADYSRLHSLIRSAIQEALGDRGLGGTNFIKVADAIALGVAKVIGPELQALTDRVSEPEPYYQQPQGYWECYCGATNAVGRSCSYCGRAL